MAAASEIVLPPGWVSSVEPDGVMLYDGRSNRGCLAVLWILAALAAMLVARLGHIQPRTAGATVMIVILAVLLLLLATWTSIARVSWHLRPNYFEKRIRARRWVHREIVTDAVLAILYHDDDGRRIPRLYAIRDGRRRQVLFNQPEPELMQLAYWIAARTGWRLQRGDTMLVDAATPSPPDPSR